MYKESRLHPRDVGVPFPEDAKAISECCNKVSSMLHTAYCLVRAQDPFAHALAWMFISGCSALSSKVHLTETRWVTMGQEPQQQPGLLQQLVSCLDLSRNFFELELLRNCKQGFDQGIVFSLLRGTTHPACLIMTSHKEDVDERKSTDTELEGQNFKVMKCFLSKPTIFSCQGIQQRYMLLRNSKNNSSLNKMEQSFARRLYSGYALPYLETSMVKDASKASAERRTTTESR